MKTDNSQRRTTMKNTTNGIMSPCKKAMTFAVMVASMLHSHAIFADDTVFYRNGSHDAWCNWSDLSSWTTVKDGSVDPDHEPGTEDGDWLWPYGTYSGGDLSGVVGKFNLGGNGYTIEGYSNGTGSGQAYKGYALHLTNGTLSVKYAVRPPTSGTSYTTSMLYYLYDGATLNWHVPDIYEGNNRIGASGLAEYFYLKSGSAANLYGLVNAYGFKVTIDAGATMRIDSGNVYISQSARYYEGQSKSMHIQIDNSGTFNVPNGLDWIHVSGNNYGNEMDRRIYVNHTAGNMILGGSFQKSEESVNRQLMKFTFSGGTITVPEGKSAGFFNPTTRHGQETFAEMAQNASATVDVGADASLDMKLFTYGSGSSLAKSGSGRLVLAARPDALAVSAGTVEFSEPLTNLTGIAFSNGTTLAFGAPCNKLDSIDALVGVSFTVADDFPRTGVILECPQAVADAVAARLVLPQTMVSAGVRLYSENGTVRLKMPVTVTACSFSIPTGGDATGCGFSVSGLEEGDYASSFKGAPVYDFGEYTASSPAGTYTVSISGLESEKYYVTSYSPGTIWAVDPSDAATFYWAAARTAYSSWSDLANWKMNAELTDPATRLPCSIDKICGYGGTVDAKDLIGSFDLGGGNYPFGGFAAGSLDGAKYKSYWLNVTNGALNVMDTLLFDRNVSWSYRANIGATINIHTCGLFLNGDDHWMCGFGAPSYSTVLDVAAGGRINVYNPVNFLAFTANVAAGGRLVFADGTFLIGNNATSSAQRNIYNDGTLSFPNGWNWVTGAGWSNSPDFTKSIHVHQRSGETRLGGDFKKTAMDSDAWRRGMYFDFEGGRLVSEANSSVAFVQNIGAKSGVEEVFASVAADASVEVETLAGSVLDMTIFTYGANSALTKIGSGELRLKDRPASLTISEGSVKFVDALDDLVGVTVSSAGTLVFGAPDNRADSLSCEPGASFTIDAAAFSRDDLILTSTDASVLATVKENFVMPAQWSERYVATIEGTSLHLRRIQRGCRVIFR